MAKKIKKMTVAEYMADYIKQNPSASITKKKVYKLINSGKLKAHKNEKGAWIIEVEIEPNTKEYTVKEFVDEYNRRHLDSIITINKVRALAAKGIIHAKKLCGKWIISDSPRKTINK